VDRAAFFLWQSALACQPCVVCRNDACAALGFDLAKFGTNFIDARYIRIFSLRIWLPSCGVILINELFSELMFGWLLVPVRHYAGHLGRVAKRTVYLFWRRDFVLA